MNCQEYFIKLLSRREYSAYELKKKGKEKGLDPSEINAAIDELQEKDYQSDTRFVESLLSSYRGKYGKFMLKRKCIEKGIESDLFDQVWMGRLKNEESDNLADLKAKIMRKYKLSNFQIIDPKTQAKLWNYLQYRGFNPREVLAQWKREEEENV